MVLNNPKITLFTELASAVHQAAGFSTWEDWDISALVPANVIALIGLQNKDVTGYRNHGVRANGSSLTRRFLTPSYVVAAGGELHTLVQVDVNGIIEIFAEAATTYCDFRVLGYWS